MMGRQAAADGKGKTTGKVTVIGGEKREETKWKEANLIINGEKKKEKPRGINTENVPKRAPECEFIVKKKKKKVIRSYGNHPNTIAVCCTQCMSHLCLSLLKSRHLFQQDHCSVLSTD